MGALTDHRKRYRFAVFDLSPSTPSTSGAAAGHTPAKKPKLVTPTSAPSLTTPPQDSTVRCFPPAGPLTRPLHGPQRIIKAFGLGSVGRAQVSRKASIFEMGNLISQFFREKKVSSSSRWKVQEASADGRDGSHDRLGLEEYKRWVVVSQDGYSVERPFGSTHSDLTVVTQDDEEPPKVVHVLSRKVEDARRTALESLPVREENESPQKPLYKELYEKSRKRDAKLSHLEFELKLTEASRLSRAPLSLEKELKQDLHDLFSPLTEEEENEVCYALNGGSSREVVVTHEASNIEITREVLRCLSSGAWLNDEVINLYLELLKEREKRDPKRFLKCHFFNTFFYKKLTSGRTGYDYKAVRRWTSQRKLGYALIECDKIFVPIHKDIHWCLAVINMRDESFQYLDSLGGTDSIVLRVLARYLMDEVKDKSDKQIDTITWKQGSVDYLPLQKNGWDCGMFMLKYTDFYSRGLSLRFGQEHMDYFRKRTVKEIIRLRAD